MNKEIRYIVQVDSVLHGWNTVAKDLTKFQARKIVHKYKESLSSDGIRIMTDKLQRKECDDHV